MRAARFFSYSVSGGGGGGGGGSSSDVSLRALSFLGLEAKATGLAAPPPLPPPLPPAVLNAPNGRAFPAAFPVCARQRAASLQAIWQHACAVESRTVSAAHLSGRRLCFLCFFFLLFLFLVLFTLPHTSGFRPRAAFRGRGA